MTDEEKNIEKFIILEARSQQIQIIDFAAIVPQRVMTSEKLISFYTNAMLMIF